MSIATELQRILSAKTDIVSAIKNKGVEVPEGALVDDLPEKIAQIKTGVDTSGATATAPDILVGKTAYVKGVKVVGTIPRKNSLIYTPGLISQTISAGQYLLGNQTIEGDVDLVDNNIKSGISIFGVAGTFTSDATATAPDILKGCSAYVKGVKVTGSMPGKAAETYTPTTYDQTISAGRYLEGDQTIAGDLNLVAGNIRNGVSIFGVAGSCGEDTTDATATEDDILTGKTAYVNGAKVTGNIAVKAAQVYTPGTNDQTISGDTYLSGDQVIVGDVDLVAGNIRNGVSIFGVAGSFGDDTTDTTATEDDILTGKTAYVNGVKVTGNITVKTAGAYTPGTNDQTIFGGQYLSGDQVIAGDVDLVAGNIRSGVSIFDVAGSFTSDATATANDIVYGKIAYVNGQKLVGTISFRGPQVFTPCVADQTISGGQYLVGTQTIKGDVNLVAGNIRNGVSIFNVAGSFTSDATATEDDILTGKTAYVNGQKLTGTIPAKGLQTYTPGLVDQTISGGQYLTLTQTIKGDSQLVAGNIRSGVSIFNVAGSFTSDATAEAGDIASGKTAYVSGQKITGTATASGGIRLYVESDCQRMFGLDFPSPVTTVQKSTQKDKRNGSLLVVNGRLYRVVGPKNNLRTVKINPDSDWEYVECGQSYYAVKGGKVVRIDVSVNAEIPVATVAQEIYSGETPVSEIKPTNSQGRVHYRVGTTAHLWRGMDTTEVTHTFDRAISRYIDIQANNGDYGSGYQAYGIATNGDIIELGTSDETPYTSVIVAAGDKPWTDFYPLAEYYGSGMGGGVYCFGMRSGGELWACNASNKAVTQIPGINGHRLDSGNLSYCEVSANENYDNETGNITYTTSEYRVGLFIDSTGNLWKLSAALNGTDLSGPTAVQVGEDADWEWVEGSISRNGQSWAVKGGRLMIIKASNTDIITLAISEFYMTPPGHFVCNYGITDGGVWQFSEG